MKYWLLFISSCLFCCVSFAQELADSTKYNGVDSLAYQDPVLELDSSTLVPKRVFQPQVYIDYGKLISTVAGFDNKLEGAVSILFFEKLEAIVEFGTARLNPEFAYVNGNYKSTGDYFRFGGSYMAALNGKSSIGLGVRYGVSKFSDEGRIEIQSASGLQDDFNLPFARNNLSARWWSAVLTSESRFVFKKSDPQAKINHSVKFGFFFRMRFLVTYENDRDPIDVYSIPGYGSAINNQQAALNLFIKFTP
ncbi:MAG: hypothetical protein JXR03_05170 [Cyclobacteriaceae bacterium]